MKYFRYKIYMEKSNSFSVFQQEKMYMDPILKETDQIAYD